MLLLRRLARRYADSEQMPRTGLKCPECARTFLVGPTFAWDIAATGRVRPSDKRAEVQCKICGHAWWSRHPEALRMARAMHRPRELGAQRA